jgi:hypothetical protein
MYYFKMFSEFATDFKVQGMSEAMQRRLTMLFCLRCSGPTEKLEDGDIATYMRISEQELAETKSLFTKKGFIDENWHVRNWSKRQAYDGSAAGRMKRLRNERRSSAESNPQHNPNITRTQPEHQGNGSGTELELELELEIHPLNPPQDGGDDFVEEFGNQEEAPKSKPSRKKQSCKAVIPEWVPMSEWEGFSEMRVKMKKPMTELAKTMLIGDLDKLRAQGHDPAAVLLQSVVKCWDSVYPLKGNQPTPNARASPPVLPFTDVTGISPIEFNRLKQAKTGSEN